MSNRRIEAVIPPDQDMRAPVDLQTLVDMLALINDALDAAQAPVIEWGRGDEACCLYLRHSDGSVERRNLRGQRGARGRQGRRGREGKPPAHEWTHDGQRVRFRNPDGSWGRWSANIVTGEP